MCARISHRRIPLQYCTFLLSHSKVLANFYDKFKLKFSSCELICFRKPQIQTRPNLPKPTNFGRRTIPTLPHFHPKNASIFLYPKPQLKMRTSVYSLCPKSENKGVLIVCRRSLCAITTIHGLGLGSGQSPSSTFAAFSLRTLCIYVLCALRHPSSWQAPGPLIHAKHIYSCYLTLPTEVL